MRALRTWLLLTTLMVANGIVRALLLDPLLGPRPAELVAAATAIALILVVARPFVRSLASATVPECIGVGAAWAGLTVVAEFACARFVAGADGLALASSYEVVDGRVWPLVVAALALTPFVWRPRTPRRLVTHPS